MKSYFLTLLICLGSLSLWGQNNSLSNCNCCTEAHRQFHFWLGKWEAFTANGQKAGDNHIVLLQDTCVMQENWVSAKGGYTGTSYNYYDASTQLWYQVWIDNQGSSLRLYGGMEGGKMVLRSDEVSSPQGKYINRITWTPNDDGTVRQHWQVSTDRGETWHTSFDGVYRRLEE
jgi:hypothetical protein